jgi:hypothetical protein
MVQGRVCSTVIASIILVAAAAALTPARAQQAPSDKLIKDADRDAIQDVKADLAAGANVNAQDEHGWTALMFAVLRSDVDLVRLLLQHGADVNLKTNEGNTALTEAYGEPLEMFRLLLDHGADVNVMAGGETPLQSAMGAVARGVGDPEVVNLLRSHGAVARYDCADLNHPREGDLNRPVCVTQSAPVVRQAAADPQKYFRHLFYTPTDGKAGYHLISQLKAYYSDLPGGSGCGLFYESSASVDGTLPAGIEWSAQKASFEGTPQEPGDWEVTVHLADVHCGQGDTADYGNRDLSVHFHIDGDAPRSVDPLR